MAAIEDVDDLKEMLLKYNVSQGDIDEFEKEIDENEYDIASIKEDIKDREQSMLLDFFRENCEGKEKIYDIVKAIMDGKVYSNKEEKQDKEESKQEQILMIKKEEKEDKKEKEEPIWKFNDSFEVGGDGTVILNAGLIIIPDIVICDPSYLESIRGITYVLYWNNSAISPPRLPYSYIDFWKEYLTEESPSYAGIASDIKNNEGPTYDYLMENPPNDRILPVLEKVVDQLRHPMLDSSLDKRNTTYHNDIISFFTSQTPDYFDCIHKDVSDRLIRCCVMFKKNTSDTNFNTFELFINIIDIYDRILYNGMAHKVMDITGERLKWNEESLRLINTHHFAAKLKMEDYYALNATLNSIKDSKCNAFFARLNNTAPFECINDDIAPFQCISLSFLLFIKAFISETGNCLEKGYHIYKAPRRRDKKKRKGAFSAVIKSLKEICENGVVSDGDIMFHNDNMPLQFDLCILPCSDSKENEYGLDASYDSFGIESSPFIVPTDRQSIYKLYGEMVCVFRAVLDNKKNKSNAKRRDDRYCIVFDRNCNRFYMYPPHILHGNIKIVHRKQVKEDIDNSVDNMFSYIASEYNDLTNFYLTNKRIMPSSHKHPQFVLSAHFHKQRQWHRHPKLRIYQYFNGGGLRFFYSHKKDIKNYKWDKDMIDLWPKYFKYGQSVNQDFIKHCDIFDDVLDLYKCDAQYFQWDNAVKRQLKKK